ncbi:hypothetical protein Patl1_14099 [Pistacia atlantica]|uniref:Uncharacterized protein n=1 Tax=Pistacia atlantica TaxID=434234 RepID=A0ACC1ATR2_9ROSI|nr:hypothetical protein Patl1_14099 [Pistacia atlantica]
MAAKQLKKKNYTEPIFSSATLISVIHSPQLPILKRLYYLLIKSSWIEAELNDNNICSLADVLFKEVDGRVLLSILRTLISVELNEKSERISITNIASACALLQVFADELLMHKSLREYFLLIDSASSTSEMLFMCHFGHGDIGTVMEPGKDFRTPEMSLIVSLSLLLNPIMHSAAKMFQPYLILLVSEAIGVCIRSENLNPDLAIKHWRGPLSCTKATFPTCIWMTFL